MLRFCALHVSKWLIRQHELALLSSISVLKTLPAVLPAVPWNALVEPSGRNELPCCNRCLTILLIHLADCVAPGLACSDKSKVKEPERGLHRDGCSIDSSSSTLYRLCNALLRDSVSHAFKSAV